MTAGPKGGGGGGSPWPLVPDNTLKKIEEGVEEHDCDLGRGHSDGESREKGEGGHIMSSTAKPIRSS